MPQRKQKEKHLNSVQIVPLHMTHTTVTAADTQGVRMGKGETGAGLSVVLKASNTKTRTAGAQDSKRQGRSDFKLLKNSLKQIPCLSTICGVIVQTTSKVLNQELSTFYTEGDILERRKRTRKRTLCNPADVSRVWCPCLLACFCS